MRLGLRLVRLIRLIRRGPRPGAVLLRRLRPALPWRLVRGLLGARPRRMRALHRRDRLGRPGLRRLLGVGSLRLPWLLGLLLAVRRREGPLRRRLARHGRLLAGGAVLRPAIVPWAAIVRIVVTEAVTVMRVIHVFPLTVGPLTVGA